MNTFMKRFRYGLAAAAAIALAGCGGSGSGSDPIGEDMGVFNLNVSDAGIDAAKVCIKFDGVQLKMADEDEPMPVKSFDPVTVNLLDVQGANSQPIWSDQVPAGTYEWIRLIVDAEKDSLAGSADTDPDDPACLAEDGSYIVTTVSVSRPLFIPSGGQSGLKLMKDITIDPDSSGNYTAEWDLGKSFITPPGLDPVVKMKPVVKLVANDEVGTLVGQVADDLLNKLTEDEACDADFGLKVYVFSNEVMPNPINYPPEDENEAFEPDPNDPVATGLVKQQEQADGSMPYRYSIGFMLPGDYEAAFTCDGENFIPADGKPARIDVGKVTEVDFILDDLPPAT